jgi:hypothetical protein
VQELVHRLFLAKCSTFFGLTNPTFKRPKICETLTRTRAVLEFGLFLIGR